MTPKHERPSIGSYRGIFRTWLPLGVKQFLTFGADPIYIAVIMRLGYANLELGALYSYAWPVILMLAAPGLTLNTVGNVFGRNLENLRRTGALARLIGFGGSALLGLVAFTPLGHWIMGSVLDVPVSERGMVRDAMRVCAIYPILKAYCMLYQGYLVRSGRAVDVMNSRIVRFACGMLILFIGLETEWLQGAVLGASAIVASLLAQTIYVWWRMRPVRTSLELEPLSTDVVSTSRLVRFSIPIAITPIVGSATVLLMAAALGRLPGVIASLAVWPIVSNFNQVGVGLGKSFDQVSMVHGDEAVGRVRLHRFGLLLGVGITLLTALLNASGLLGWLLLEVEALDAATIRVTEIAMWILLPMPLLYTMCAYYKGLLARELRTVPIMVSKFVALVIVALVLVWSLDQEPVMGVYAVATATVVSAGATLLTLRIFHRRGTVAS